MLSLAELVLCECRPKSNECVPDTSSARPRLHNSGHRLQRRHEHCVASKPELARYNDFQNFIASTLLDLAHAGQIEPRELTRIALVRARNYVRPKQ
jgi:hypothetical protein